MKKLTPNEPSRLRALMPLICVPGFFLLVNCDSSSKKAPDKALSGNEQDAPPEKENGGDDQPPDSKPRSTEFIDRMRANGERKMQGLAADHPERLVGRAALAEVLVRNGRVDEGEKELIEVLAMQRRVLGPTHTDTFGTWRRYAEALTAGRKYQESERNTSI